MAQNYTGNGPFRQDPGRTSNGLGVPIAAGVLYPMTGLLLSPIIAAAAMSLSSVSVIMNALRLRCVNLTFESEHK
ncbi:TPA: hypothetical protein I8Z14_002295 [Legionella pneumophila]|nr:hypothetical protein [Legionella pneumophila]